MRRIIRRVARFIAPTAYRKLEAMRVQDDEQLSSSAEITVLRDRVAELELQLKEVRQDGRRVAELYDLVFERLRAESPLRRG